MTNPYPGPVTTDPVARLRLRDTLPNPNRDAGAAGSGVSRDTPLAEARLARRSARLLARDPLRAPFSDVRSLPRDAFSAAKTSPPCFSSSFTSPFCVRPVWKSTSELGYHSAWTFVNIHAIEPTRSRGQRRVDGLETPRHRADAATEPISRRWRGAPEI